MKLTRSQLRDLAIDSVVLIDGVKHWVATCGRCGGSGRYSWCERFADHCFECGTAAEVGHGKRFVKSSPEQRAKAAARRERRRAAQEAKAQQAAIRTALPAFAAAVVRSLERVVRDRAVELEKAKSEHVGAPKKRLDLELTFEFSTSWSTRFGMQSLYAFRDGGGNRLVWKTGGCLYLEAEDGQWIHIEKGQAFRAKATVKAHSQYNGERQTELTRVKVLEVL